jgi:hypothetical protein
LEDQADCGGLCGDDSITFTMPPAAGSNQFFQLVADDPSATALGVGSGHLTNTIAGALSILDSLDLDRYELRSATQTSSWVGPGGDSDKIYFTWTGISRVPVVPIPSPLLLLASGLLALLTPWHRVGAIGLRQ